MKITNREVMQSYLVTTAKYDFSVYEKRVLYRLIEALQEEIKGKKLDTYFKKNIFNEDRIVTMPIKSILCGEDDKNHKRVIQALISLRNKTFEIEDELEWKLVGVIEKPKIKKRAEFVIFEIQNDIYNALFDFAKGYRKIELKTAMNFESHYAMRFYELFSNTKAKQTFSLEWLKVRFGLEKKYKLTADFIRYVILPAQKELDEKSPYSFKFETIKEGRKITKIDFYPIAIPKNADEDLEAKKLQQKVSPRWDISKQVLDILTYNFGFTMSQIKRNMEVFKQAQNKMDLIYFITLKLPEAEGKRNPKGWLINALKSELKNEIC